MNMIYQFVTLQVHPDLEQKSQNQSNMTQNEEQTSQQSKECVFNYRILTFEMHSIIIRPTTLVLSPLTVVLMWIAPKRQSMPDSHSEISKANVSKVKQISGWYPYITIFQKEIHLVFKLSQPMIYSQASKFKK